MKHVRVKCLPKDKTSTQYPSIQREETRYFAENLTPSGDWNLVIYYHWSYGVLLRGRYELRCFTSVTELRYASTHSYVYKIKVSWNKLSHKLCLINYVCLGAVLLLQTCWASVADGVSALPQHWVGVSCLLGNQAWGMVSYEQCHELWAYNIRLCIISPPGC